MAGELHWFQPYDKVLQWDMPFAQWFVHGQTNISYNCLDVHLGTPREKKVAFLWEGEPGDTRTLTYRDLHAEVCKFANVLKSLGVGKGDMVALYMPMIPELPIAMLACARSGQSTRVVFGGFSGEAIAERNNDAAVKLMITADAGWRRGKHLPLKENVDLALAKSPTVEKCVVVRRAGSDVTMAAGRDFWWHELMAQAAPDCPAEPMDSEAPLFILYTSGSTGKPKGIKHTTAGYNLFAKKTMEWVFDIRDDDVYWSTADIGWITGHSYVVYGPLAAGATTLLYEGAPDWPDKDRWWDMIEQLPRQHPLHGAHRHPHLHQVGRRVRRPPRPLQPPLAGERGRGDQSRGLDVVPREDRRRALPDRRYLVADRDRRHHDQPAARGHGPEAGQLHQALAGHHSRGGRRRRPAARARRRGPAGDRPALAGHDARHLGRRRALQGPILRDVPGKYLCGDNARCDDDGYYWIMGRIDDVLNVSGHRLSTIEIESALVSHPAVAEAAVVGRPARSQGGGHGRLRHPRPAPSSPPRSCGRS